MPLCFVPTPIGNLDDITVRALKKLESAEVVFCEDTRVSKKLFGLLSKRHGISETTASFISLHSHNETAKLQDIDVNIFNKNCVYVCDAGMPCVSDPGSALINFCRLNGVNYEVLPGASSVITAFAASGILQTEFCFMGFLPHKLQAKTEKLTSYFKESRAVIFFESPHRLIETLKVMASLEPNRLVFAAKELTKLHEKYFLQTTVELCDNLKNQKILGEWVIIIYPSEDEPTISDSIFKPNMDKKSLSKAISKITGQDAKSIYSALTANLR